MGSLQAWLGGRGHEATPALDDGGRQAPGPLCGRAMTPKMCAGMSWGHDGRLPPMGKVPNLACGHPRDSTNARGSFGQHCFSGRDLVASLRAAVQTQDEGFAAVGVEVPVRSGIDSDVGEAVLVQVAHRRRPVGASVVVPAVLTQRPRALPVRCHKDGDSAERRDVVGPARPVVVHQLRLPADVVPRSVRPI